MKNKTKLLAASMILLSGVAHAEVYICKDASGKTLTSDRPIPECQDRKMRVLGNNGLTKREILPPLSEEEKRQKLADDEKRKNERIAAEEQKRQDRAILARYSKESDIELARSRALEMLDEQIKRAKASLAESEKNLKGSQNLLATHKSKGSVPAYVQRTAEDAERVVTENKKQLAEHQEEIVNINAKFDQTLKRFRELNAAIAQNAAKPIVR